MALLLFQICDMPSLWKWSRIDVHFIGRFDCCDLSWAETKLKGLVVWVTGASSGIGEELAYQLARCGSRLILSARREDELRRVKRHCLGKRLIAICKGIDGLIKINLTCTNILSSALHPVHTQSRNINSKGWTEFVTFLFSLIQLRPAEFFLSFILQEKFNVKDEDILVLPLDLLERTSHEAKTKTVIQYFGHVRPLQLLFFYNTLLSLKRLCNLCFNTSVTTMKLLLLLLSKKKIIIIVTLN